MSVYKKWYVVKTQSFTIYFVVKSNIEATYPKGDAYTFYLDGPEQGVNISRNRELFFITDARTKVCGVQQFRKAIRDLFKMNIS